ncbi:uncharacterized protein LOC111674042 [Orussus abietinus]|uniref:uncharacterized protein LOC111674042 n=1 Tax=Orussus abietinus TaxID=222816 RepID=UPI000C716295|nr:uncharacterized protein LOC111674042 [Orussus abietinus]
MVSRSMERTDKQRLLKEASGQFGPVVEKTLFRPQNIFPLASKSGKLTSEHFKTWLKDVLYPNIGQQSILLLDSWSGHCSDTIEKTKPADKKIVSMMIPKGTTPRGRIRPLDVCGFRVWKNFVRRFSDIVLLHNYDVNLHLRNNIIKLQSLEHNQLSSPRYKSLFQYARCSRCIAIIIKTFAESVELSFVSNAEP